MGTLTCQILRCRPLWARSLGSGSFLQASHHGITPDPYTPWPTLPLSSPYFPIGPLKLWLLSSEGLCPLTGEIRRITCTTNRQTGPSPGTLVPNPPGLGNGTPALHLNPLNPRWPGTRWRRSRRSLCRTAGFAPKRGGRWFKSGRPPTPSTRPCPPPCPLLPRWARGVG